MNSSDIRADVPLPGHVPVHCPLALLLHRLRRAEPKSYVQAVSRPFAVIGLVVAGLFETRPESPADPAKDNIRAGEALEGSYMAE